MRISKLAKVASLALAFGLVAGSPAYAVDLQGSGASFPALLIEACKAGFAASNGGENSYVYASSSSGTGQANSDKKIGDFWMSDGAYTAATRRASLIHVPLVAAPIAILHNLPSTKTLQLSASTIAGIFGGTITRWNDPAIVADNNRKTSVVVYKLDANGNPKKDAKGNLIVLRTKTVATNYPLPNHPIKVIYRSDSSGTSENFTNYLAKSASSVWTKAKSKVFKDSFPGDINSVANLGRIVGAASSTGVAQLAGKTPYSITYAEVNYAEANKLKISNVINPSGASVVPNSTGVGAFLASATQDSNGFLTYDYATKEPGAYPLGIVSYLLADTAYASKAQADAVKAYATYILSSKCSNDVGAALGFSVIDGELLKKSLAQVAKIG
ncbi:MAG: extracellular solute-binding protein [Actinobacteria bacterium]|nr:extracellular solute-binding protein [Actinomycetota bacterium]